MRALVTLLVLLGATDTAAAEDRAPALEELAIPGYEPALVAPPRGSDAPRPVLVATHGANDRAEAHCAMWRAIVDGRAFVLCPRGRPSNRGATGPTSVYYYPDAPSLAREVTAALEALRARYGDRVDTDRPAYAGFSQGAIDGAELLPSHPASFARAVLIEGGTHGWAAPTAEALYERGAERVLFACGTEPCRERATAATRVLEDAGVDARLVYVAAAGHNYGGDVERAVQGAFAWVIEGDDRWR